MNLNVEVSSRDIVLMMSDEQKKLVLVGIDIRLGHVKGSVGLFERHGGLED